MSRPSSTSRRPRVVVAGAGALGLAIALRLADEGCDVALVDPSPVGENASGVAAGMLAPAFEAALDASSFGDFPLLQSARDLWPALVERLDADIGFRRSGALWIDLPGEAPQFETCLQKLHETGAAVETWDAIELRARVPGLAAGPDPAIFTPEDWRVDPRVTLAAFRRSALSAGVGVFNDRVVAFDRSRVRLAGGASHPADSLVVATGFGPSGLAPELAALTPIKGQIICFPTVRAADDRPVLRTALGYLASGLGGLRVGATMEVGAHGVEIDPARVGAFASLARMVFPAEAGEAHEAHAGIRASTPDGLPMVGPSAAPGVYLATGARRNGWLLAPLVAEMTAAYVMGRDPGPYSRRLAAQRRFGRDGERKEEGRPRDGPDGESATRPLMAP